MGNFLFVFYIRAGEFASHNAVNVSLELICSGRCKKNPTKTKNPAVVCISVCTIHYHLRSAHFQINRTEPMFFSVRLQPHSMLLVPTYFNFSPD